MQGLPVAYLELEAIYARTLGQGMRSLAICAANSGEGVSMLAVALARRAQAGGHRVLLVEMNLYQPTMANQFGLERQAWLPALHTNEPSQLPMINMERGFGLLPASLSHEASVRLREPNVLEGCLRDWLGSYDHVIFDTSPLNATNQNNIPAERIAAACDGCFMLVLAGVTSQTAIIQAKRHLDAVGARLVGAAFNDRLNPSLAFEIARESDRVARFLPRLSAWLKRKVALSALLNFPA